MFAERLSLPYEAMYSTWGAWPRGESRRWLSPTDGHWIDELETYFNGGDLAINDARAG
jgi:hypothetical protein